MSRDDEGENRGERRSAGSSRGGRRRSGSRSGSGEGDRRLSSSSGGDRRRSSDSGGDRRRSSGSGGVRRRYSGSAEGEPAWNIDNVSFPSLLGNTCYLSENELWDRIIGVNDRATPPQADSINMREGEYYHHEEEEVEGSRHVEGEGNNEDDGSRQEGEGNDEYEGSRHEEEGENIEDEDDEQGNEEEGGNIEDEDDEQGNEESRNNNNEESRGVLAPPQTTFTRGRATTSGAGYMVRVKNFHGGTVARRRMTVRDTHHLPLYEKVLLDYFSRTGQPMGSEGNLFNRFCRDVGTNYNYFPIDLNDWKEMPEEKRAHGWENIVKKKFDVPENKAVRNYGIRKIGDGWKTRRNEYFNKRNPLGNRPESEIIEDCPPGVPREHWGRYVVLRNGPKGKERSRAGKEARKCQVVRHTAGSRPFSVILGDMLRDGHEHGRSTHEIVRDFLLEIRRHADGSYVAYAEDELEIIDRAAREFADAEGIDNDQYDRDARVMDPFDVIARLRAAIGAREHSGRVPGLGFGATPTQVYGPRSRTFERGSTSGTQSQSYEGQQIEDRVRRQLEEQERRLKEKAQREREEQERRFREERQRDREEIRREWEELRRDRDELRREIRGLAELRAEFEEGRRRKRNGGGSDKGKGRR